MDTSSSKTLSKDDCSYCLTVPHYNHFDSFVNFLPQLLSLGIPCIVIDDGSDAEQFRKLKELLNHHSEITLLTHNINRGKGAAILTAASYARQLGHTHIIQIDADGQHNVDDVARLIELSKNHPHCIVSGMPKFADDAPKARVYGRKVTTFWVALETLSFKIKDSLCGFRVYPLMEFEQVYDNYHIGSRMTFDTDILVKSCWENIDLKFIDTNVIYIENNASHFHYLRDNLLLIRLHTNLMLGMLIRIPKIIYQRFSN
ncbi:UNVERIFIED_CONTAM: hypothetical protein GTU68_039407 [Idotea baltica]|nr:hypothetical protein [Idotea baltica]